MNPTIRRPLCANNVADDSEARRDIEYPPNTNGRRRTSMACAIITAEETVCWRNSANKTLRTTKRQISSHLLTHLKSAFTIAFVCFHCFSFSRCNAVNISPRLLDPGQQNYPQQQIPSNPPYGTNSNNNVVPNSSYNNNNNGMASGPPVVEPDYSSYLHWFFYFSPITLSWLSSNIVPDLIAVPPPLPLLVGFDSKAAVYWGNDLAPSLVRNQPVFLHWPTQPGMLYTIVMAAPDVPANEKPSSVLWVVVNIPGTRVDRGDVIVEYPGAAPPRDTGKHRYVFLVFKQTSRIHTSGYPEVTRRQFENRASFDVHHFAMHFKLGYPIAGNFFLSEYDDYVPFIYKQLGV